MAIPVEMPKMSDTMDEGVLVAWLVDEGASIAPGDVIAQVETDKATMDLESYDDGVLLKKVVGEGDSVPIGGLIAVLGSEGEDISDLLAKYENGAGKSEQKEAERGTGSSSGGDDQAIAEPSGDGVDASLAEPEVIPAGDGQTKSSPLARKLAREHGLDIGRLRGSGPEGRVIKRDVEAAIGDAPAEASPARRADPRPAVPPRREPEAPLTPAVEFGPDKPDDVVRISQMRKTVARRLAESKFTAPHFYLTIDVDMSASIEARNEVNALAERQGQGKISFNDFVTKAVASALRYHPQVNASYNGDDGVIAYHKQAHVAVAVAVEEGLMTPVIRNADGKGLLQIASETRTLADRARNKQLQPEEYQGSTFTTSNLGMFGIQEFTAIINPPNACILAIGGIRDAPVVRDGAVVPGKMMKLTLSCDHRVVDGAIGAAFLDTVRRHLEQPATMLL